MSRLEEGDGDDLVRIVRLRQREFRFDWEEAVTLVQLVDDAGIRELALKMQDAFDPFSQSGRTLVFEPDADEKKTLCRTLSNSASSRDQASMRLLFGLRRDPDADYPTR